MNSLRSWRRVKFRAQAEKEGRLMKVTVADLGLPEGGDIWDVHRAATKLGLEGLSPEVFKVAGRQRKSWLPGSTRLTMIKEIGKSSG